VWGTRGSPRLRPAGEWGNRVAPCPHPREGLGGRSPPKNKLIFIAALCGAAAWTADGNISSRSGGVGNPGFPTPPPARGPGPQAGVWGTRGSPDPCSQGLPRGRIREGRKPSTPAGRRPRISCGTRRQVVTDSAVVIGCDIITRRHPCLGTPSSSTPPEPIHRRRCLTSRRVRSSIDTRSSSLWVRTR